MLKKIIIFISILLFSFNVFGQNQPVSTPLNTEFAKDNNELKINLAMSIGGLPEITYERFIADNMGVGLSAAISLDNSLATNAIILPYYRVYFGSKKAAGFFIEGNGAMVVEKQYSYNYDHYGYYSSSSTSSVAHFGLGAALGVKFLTRNGLLGEIHLGLGRLFINNGDAVYPRIGLTLGKRF
jgi:hypothetical protein